MPNEEYHLYRSSNNSERAITIGEREDGTFFLGRAGGILEDHENKFESIEEIELYLDDELEMLRPKEH